MGKKCDVSFDVAIGSYHSAKASELVVQMKLHKLQSLGVNMGISRDCVMDIFSILSR